jgi:hypothetical protein
MNKERRLSPFPCKFPEPQEQKPPTDIEEFAEMIFNFHMDIKTIATNIEMFLKAHHYKRVPAQFPEIVCLCGSTRFSEAFQKAQLELTLAGKIVLTIGCNMKSDTEVFGHLTETELKDIKSKLDELHKRKIDLANEVFILNVGGYIGVSTWSEIEYATKLGKPIKYLEPGKLTRKQFLALPIEVRQKILDKQIAKHIGVSNSCEAINI